MPVVSALPNRDATRARSGKARGGLNSHDEREQTLNQARANPHRAVQTVTVTLTLTLTLALTLTPTVTAPPTNRVSC